MGGGGGEVWGDRGGRWGFGCSRAACKCSECSTPPLSLPAVLPALPQVLIALVAGEDAERFESLPDHVVLAKALAVLRSIFGDKAVPEVSKGCGQ